MSATIDLLTAARSRDRVAGLTHGIYRYPARFSPQFARVAIDSFTDRDEYVLDPFVGGGTTAVEALASGRRFVGFDLNPLCLLLVAAKTTPLYPPDWVDLRRWIERKRRGTSEPDPDDPRLRNAPMELVNELGPLARAIARLDDERQRAAAKALLLHVGQKAIDGRAEPMNADAIRPMLGLALKELREGLERLQGVARQHGVVPSMLVRRRVLAVGSTGEIARGRGTNRLVGRIRLVLTSPPYPGVHVLYHRWQVHGRSETALPYWLSGMEDGLGAKHYTMGSRSAFGDDEYFKASAAAWKATHRLMAPNGAVVQLLAFARPESQLPRYLTTMSEAGFDLVEGDTSESWRMVPNRKWYFRVAPERPPAHEVLLVHRRRD